MKVNEIFYSLQGEGRWTGTPAVFVRLSGCNRKCAFCDTDHERYTEMTESEIVARVEEVGPGAPIVIFTGGEPAMQLTATLVDKIKRNGHAAHIETNGTLPVPENLDWVTCSPKTPPYALRSVDELKIVYQGQDVEALAAQFEAKVKSLQPCSGQNVAETVAYIKAHPWWRLSIQLHKIIGIE